ncbi:hypothetical protein MRY87_00130 [bacterium]|nr:hypothetical protein [bacterium]
MVGWFVVLTLVLVSVSILIRYGRRSAADVLLDLQHARELLEGEEGSTTDREKRTLRGVSAREKEEDDLFFQAGFFRREQRRAFEKKMRQNPILWGIVCGVLAFIFSQNFILAVGVFAGVLSGVFLFYRRLLVLKKHDFLYDINFYLPVVMERLVMTAQAGLDVFSGIRVVSELSRDDEEKLQQEIDPVTLLLERVYYLNERGMGFEDALSQVAEKIESPALRHAFIHLAVAQKEGGELVGPLRELSDSTQLYFQEMIEEEIAKLPVKATIPLMVTFAGLVLFFMTSPMIQVMKLSTGGIGP